MEYITFAELRAAIVSVLGSVDRYTASHQYIRARIYAKTGKAIGLPEWSDAMKAEEEAGRIVRVNRSVVRLDV